MIFKQKKKGQYLKVRVESLSSIFTQGIRVSILLTKNGVSIFWIYFGSITELAE